MNCRLQVGVTDFPKIMLYCMPTKYVCFLRTGRSQNPENKSVLFFICPRLCGMQHSGYENPSIHVTSGSNQSLNSVRSALYHRRITRH